MITGTCRLHLCTLCKFSAVATCFLKVQFLFSGFHDASGKDVATCVQLQNLYNLHYGLKCIFQCKDDFELFLHVSVFKKMWIVSIKAFSV